jgi:hypothetical protein
MTFVRVGYVAYVSLGDDVTMWLHVCIKVILYARCPVLWPDVTKYLNMSTNFSTTTQ